MEWPYSFLFVVCWHMIINKEDEFVLHLTKRDLEQLKYTLECVIEEWKDKDDALDYFSIRQELERWYKSICSMSK